jgi:2-dehydropantoate 2-reductase
MRVAVMGAGGTGGYFGGLLARAGEDVTFIARGAQLRALQTGGLRVRSRLAGDFDLAVRVTADPAEVGPVGLVLFCVKTYDTEAAAERIRPLVGSDTVILPVQNGIDDAERIGRVVGSAPVIGGVALVSSVLEAPGVVSQTAGVGRLIVGELGGGASPRIERLVGVLARAGIPAQAHPDIRVALWQKFVFICAFSGLTALTRLPIGPILANPETARLYRETMAEVAAVGHAEGVALPDTVVDEVAAMTARLEPWARGSLYYDLMAGRRLELAALQGTVVRLGRARAVPTPANGVIHAALSPYADGPPAVPSETRA